MSGLDPIQQEAYLLKRIDNSNRAIKISIISAVGIALLTMFFIVFQLFALQNQISDTLIQGQKTGAANHARTQQYIKCIVLLLINERTEENFDKCGKTGKVDPKTGAFIPDTERNDVSSTSIGGVETAPLPPTQSTAPKEQETISGGSPPRPNDNTPATPPPTLLDTLQQGLKGVLNGVESRIDQLEKGI